ncbi:MFS transporter [Streptomyces flavofungini]|uniref:MFS transporter n=1 Tax=Streptomyces flavofungini TaxID=68200 RepID=A0ABS0XF04_9ACTN|nr:MFS transporter [Streptomyces flavofungini]MBJ3811811.1 MFS transporter [Streptomyces flavofungini]
MTESAAHPDDCVHPPGLRVRAGSYAEHFSAYEIGDRGPARLGPPLFGLTYQLTGSRRDAILSLVALHVPSCGLHARVPVRRGFSNQRRRPVVYAFGLPGGPLLRAEDSEALGDICCQM